MKLDEKEAAAKLGLSPKTLRSWRSRKKGPPYSKYEGAIRYDSDEIEQYDLARRHEPFSVRAAMEKRRGAF
jgi:hypothetical protein